MTSLFKRIDDGHGIIVSSTGVCASLPFFHIFSVP